MGRMERWVAASFSATPFEQYMPIVVQGLGRLDVSLIEGDESFLADFERKKASIEETFKLNERFTLSYLWVLGAYELVRSICQRIDEKSEIFPSEIAQRFFELKRRFNRLRVPLAKMEPASGHQSDSHIAYPALNLNKGIAWQLTPSDFITRQDLADQLLTVLEAARRMNPELDVSQRDTYGTTKTNDPASGGAAA